MTPKCLHCENDNGRDFPVCGDCESTCHFTSRTDCRCLACEDARDLAQLPAALQDRFKDSVLIATSDDEPDKVRVPFRFEYLKPEIRQRVAVALAETVKEWAKAA
jgi:hypothetical protein